MGNKKERTVYSIEGSPIDPSTLLKNTDDAYFTRDQFEINVIFENDFDRIAEIAGHLFKITQQDDSDMIGMYIFTPMGGWSEVVYDLGSNYSNDDLDFIAYKIALVLNRQVDHSI